ncbi:MAG: Sec-independent protein translocase protein TatB [Rhodospirillales bacterium]|nr:Sec-independent protein translocase protein TatB [Rhodospirillales bacterium]
MLDIGWTEVLVISVVVLFVVGPRDIPKVLRTVGQWAGKIRALAKEFRESVDDAVREAELDEVRKTVESARSGFRHEIRSTIDPGGELTRSLQDIRVPSDSNGSANSAVEEETPKTVEPEPIPPSPPPARPPTMPGGTPLAQPAGTVARAASEPKEPASRPVGLRHVRTGDPEQGSDEA